MAVESTKEAREKLQLRLSRVIGQLQGLQKRLAAAESDCLADIQQIKAAKNALWKVAEAYLEIHLAECVHQKKSPVEIQDNLQSVIRATFTM
ncbi:MAG: metal-sensitive transcriptional regulator [Turneriella sp.]